MHKNIIKVTTIYAFSVKNCLTGVSQEGTI